MPILGHQTIGLHQPEEKFLMNAFKLEGTSMLPLFKPGEVVIVQPFSLQPSAFSLFAGDCAVYNYEGRTLLHRVLGTEEKGAWLSDDAGLLAPHFVPWGRIEGKVISNNPLKNGITGLGYSKFRQFLSCHVH